MAVSPAFAEVLIDALAPLGRIDVRRMFGGGGIYCDGLMFGLIADDVLYLKADTASKKPYEDEGRGPFVYDGKGKPISMSYWRIPERLLDEPDELVEWARIALGVARRAAANKGAAKSKAKAKPTAKSKSKPSTKRPR